MTPSSAPSAADVAEHKKAVRPILRWAGSKYRLLSALTSQMPETLNRYYEPFAGSACLFLRVRPRAAVLGDMNSELISAYRTIRARPDAVMSAVAKLPCTKREYYRQRALRPKHLPAVDRAARFLYLNRHCFNGVYRTNREGQFNVPRGRQTGDLPSLDHVRQFADHLRSAELRAGDFSSTLSDVKHGDFVYLDPPYHSATRPTYGEYGYGAFTLGDLPRLMSTLYTLDQKGVHFLFSYSQMPPTASMPAHWRSVQLRVIRNVAGFADARRRASEILIANYPKQRNT